MVSIGTVWLVALGLVLIDVFFAWRKLSRTISAERREIIVSKYLFGVLSTLSVAVTVTVFVLVSGLLS